MIGGSAVRFGEEPFAKVWDEWYELGLAHWKETEGYQDDPPAPRKDMYLKYAELGLFHIFTIRGPNGQLVGHAGFYLTPSMHTGKLLAKEDSWYVAPAFRKGFMVIRFLRFVEKALREKGAHSCMMSTKLVNGAGRVLGYMGYKHIADVYLKRF